MSKSITLILFADCQSNVPLTVSGRSSVLGNNEGFWGAPLALTPISYTNHGFWHSDDGDLNPWIAFKRQSTHEVIVVEVDDRKDCCLERFLDVEVSVGPSPDVDDSGKISCGKLSYRGDGITTYT